ncbi:MAG: glycosyltransferase family 2 protein [Gammaproteobacteria bacterium]|nr:MAG: glycosyltransferase family 2 protein [Gammaproteobacteria bacterium]
MVKNLEKIKTEILDFSILIPCRNEINFIEVMINSVLRQDAFKSLRGEIIVIDGSSTDGTNQLLLEMQSKIKSLKLYCNHLGYVSSSLNIGIENAQGKYLVRMDAHSEYPDNYISTIISYMEQHADVENAGVPWNTVPTGNSKEAVSIAHMLSHKFGVGTAMYKLECEEPCDVDTVPFGCFRRTIFEKLGLFDLELIRNQDDEFNGRIINSGGRIVLLPGPKITYFARASYKKLWLTYYQYGLFKPLTVSKLRKPATIRQLIPPFFVLGILTLLVLMLCRIEIAFFMGFIGTFLYGWIGVLATKDLKKRSYYDSSMGGVFSYFPFVFTAMFLTHVSYGWGYLIGVAKLIAGKRNASMKSSR